MSRVRTLITMAPVVVLLVACSHDDIGGPRMVPTAAAAQAEIVHVGGAWTWSSVEEVSFPPFLAMLLGVVPEGDLTHGQCESSGTMSLTQTGAFFDGDAQRLSNACVTAGGQPFSQPGTTFTITDGRVTGGSVHFSLGSPTVSPCPHHARISELEGGEARALSGKGRCILPGHPRSGSPLQADPPPQGRSRTTSWEAEAVLP